MCEGSEDLSEDLREDLLTIPEAAARIGVSERTLYRLLKADNFAARTVTQHRLTVTGRRLTTLLPPDLVREIAQAQPPIQSSVPWGIMTAGLVAGRTLGRLDGARPQIPAGSLFSGGRAASSPARVVEAFSTHQQKTCLLSSGTMTPGLAVGRTSRTATSWPEIPASPGGCAR